MHFPEVEVVNRAVTIFAINQRMTDSPIQITIYEIRHFTLKTYLYNAHVNFFNILKSLEQTFEIIS